MVPKFGILGHSKALRLAQERRELIRNVTSKPGQKSEHGWYLGPGRGTSRGSCLSQRHSPVGPMAMAPMSLGWPTFPPTLAQRAPDHERVRREYQTDSHLAGLRWKEDTTWQNVPSMPRFPSIEQRHTVPKKAISCLHRSSGSLGLSEAWPQPAHTACKHREA